MDDQDDLKFYKDNGFVIIRNLLSSDEVAHYKKLMKNVFPELVDHCTDIGESGESNFSWGLADGIRKRKEFWPLIWNKRIIRKVSSLLEGEIKFCIHNDLHFNNTQAAFEDGNPQKIIGWHRDSRFRGHYLVRDGWIDKIRNQDYKEIWDESEYPVAMARLGIYLNSYDEHQTPLFMIPGSHLTERSIRYVLERLLWNKIVANVRSFFQGDTRPRSFPYIRSKPHPFCLPAKPINARVNSGDAVLFDKRMIHGIGKRQGERCCMFLDYGLENPHTYDHINFIMKERTDMPYLKSMPTELEEKLKEKNLLLGGWESFNGSPMTGRMSLKPEQHVLDSYK